MNVWEWESFERIVTPLLFKVTNAGPLLGPIQNFSIARDSKRRLNLETLVVGDAKGGAVDHPAGTVRRTIETVEFVGASGQTCVAHGVLPGSESGTWDNSGVEHTKQKSNVQSIKALLKPGAQPAYVIEWFENLNGRDYVWSGSIIKDKNSIVDTRTIGVGDSEIILSGDHTGGSMSSTGAKLVVDGNELYIFSADPKLNENLIGPGFIIYRGNPDDDVRKKIRNSISFCLGSCLVYLGCTVLDRDSEVVSLTAVGAPGVGSRIFDLVSAPPAPLGKKYQGEVDQQILSRMVNAIYAKYDELQFSELSWAYWHAVCAPVHMAATHFGAAIEALQRAYGKIHPEKYQTNLIGDKNKWKSLRDEICQTIAKAGLEPSVIDIMKRKVESGLNQMPKDKASEILLKEIGIELSEIENAAWKRRHIGAHGGEMPEDSIIDTIRETKLLKIILHRMVLKITGASNSYFDYYTLNFPIRKLTDPVPSPTPHSA